MKTRAILLLLSLGVAALLIGWVVYPTSIPAASYSANQLNSDSYVALKQEVLAYGSANRARGVEVRGDARAIGSIALYCKGIPLIVAANDPQAMSLQVFGAANARPPGLSTLVNSMMLRLKMAGRFEVRNAQQEEISAVDRFVLKHRDRVDIDSGCGMQGEP